MCGRDKHHDDDDSSRGDIRDSPPCWGPLHSMQSRAVLVCWGSHKTTPWPGQLKQHKGIFSQSWKLEIQDQGVMGLVSCEATLLGL